MAGGASAMHSASAARVLGPQAREQATQRAKGGSCTGELAITVHVVKGCEVVRPAEDHRDGLEPGHLCGRRACRPSRQVRRSAAGTRALASLRDDGPGRQHLLCSMRLTRSCVGPRRGEKPCALELSKGRV